MAFTLKTEDDIVKLREGGKRLAHILTEVAQRVAPGVTTLSLNELTEKLIREGGDEPSLLGYTPRGAKRPYPATMCISVNEEVVHGIPTENSRVLQDGDIVGLDCVMTHQGLMVDATVTVIAGKASKESKRLLQATKEGLEAGIKAARGGNHIGDIGAAVDAVAEKYGYGNVDELGGHGVGYKVHEEPYVPNFGQKGTGVLLVPGMVLAIEPMFTEGSPEVKLLRDGYTFVTKDGSRAAHFEHTIVITDGAAEVLTKA